MLANINESAVEAQLHACMAEYGIIVDPIKIIADGKFHRVGDAWFIAYMDGRPAGKFGHNALYPGEKFSFRFEGEVAPETAEERREREARSARAKVAKEAERRHKAENAAQNAVRILSGAVPYSADSHAALNSYFDRKIIADACGALFGDFPTFDATTGKPTVIKNAILIPMRDLDGRVWSLQAIFPDANNVLGRDRTYLAGGDKNGKFFTIGNPRKVHGQDCYVVCEGFATGVAIHHATGHAVRVAFDAGSLEPVAQVLRDAYPDATILIAGDNDRWKDPARNPGLSAMWDAASAVGGWGVWPPFMADAGKVDAAGKLHGPTDFDDWVRLHGAASVHELFDKVHDTIRKVKAEAADAIEKARRADLPVFGPNDLPAASLPGVSLTKHCQALNAFSRLPEGGKDLRVTRHERELRQARAYEPCKPGVEGMHHSAASYAWTLSKRRVRYMPSDIDSDTFVAQIRCAGAPIHEKTLARIGGWLDWMCSVRESAALLRVNISNDAKARHIYTPCVELPELTTEDYCGVILIRAPMGSGKTQKIGAGFANFAKHGDTVSGDARFVAIVHRVTLVSELVRTLKLTHYRDGRFPITKENAVDVTALGVCLPSINRRALRVIMENCKHLLIDEISQVLTFLESKKCFADDGESSRQGVYAALQELVRNATCIIGMDAGVNDRVIEFIEKCRPNEQFRIYDMRKKDEGLSVKYGFGSKAVDMAYEEANRRLDAGQKLWIGCDSRKQANELHEALTKIHGDKRFILITRDTTDRKEQRDFLANADVVSRGYDCVIHSPSISSGLSVEHKRKGADGNVEFDENGNAIIDPHFDHAMFIGGGCSISAPDALQMMRRVRYLRTWTVAIHQNNTESGPTDSREIMAAKEQGVAAEWKRECPKETAWYFAGIEADRNGARTEFANELLWLMQDAQFTVVRAHQTEDRFDSEAREEARLKIETREKSMILAARDLSQEEAERLERASDKTDEDHAALKRYEIACLFGVDVFNIAPENIIDAPLWDAYKDGRGLRWIDRFSADVHGFADTSEGAVAIEDMRFDVARLQFGAILWGDTILKPGNQIDRAAAAGIVERAMANRVTFAYHGVIHKRWAVGKAYKSKENPLEEVADMLKLLGLEVIEMERTGKKGTGAAIEIDPVSFAFMEEWSARRRAMQTGVRYVAPAAPAPLPTLAERIQALQAQGDADVLATMIVFGALFDRLNATLPKGEQLTRKALAETLEGMGMHLFSKALKLKRGGKWIQSTVYVDGDLTGSSNEAVRNALNASAGLGGDCDFGAVMSKRTGPVLQSPPRAETFTQQGNQAKTDVPTSVDSYELSNDEFWAIDMPAPDTSDDLDLMLIAAMME